MPQLAVSAVGAGIGFVVGGHVGAQIGWAAGSLIGGIVFAPDAPNKKADLRSPKLQLGATMPRIYGTLRVALSPRWQSNWRASESGGGGKGGGGAEGYTYSCDLLTWFADVAGLPEDLHIKGWSRLWWNSELVATRLVESGVESIAVETDKWDAVTFHGGGAAQLPWPVYEAALSAENADAHRRVACISFENLRAGTWSNLPLLEAEVYTSGAVDDLEELAPLKLGPWANTSAASKPRHSLGATTYRYPAIGAAIYEGPDLAAAEDAMLATSDYATTYVGYYTSRNDLLSTFSVDTDTAADGDINDQFGARYVYLGYNWETPEHIIFDSLNDGSTDLQWCYPLACIKDVSVMASSYPQGIGTGGAATGHVGIAKLFAYGVEEYPWSRPADPGETFGANCVNCSPENGFFPIVLGLRNQFIRAERTPVAPAGYTEESGTFKQLVALEQNDIDVLAFPVGPVLRDTDPDYSSSTYWDAAADAAGISGSYGVEYPQEVSTAGVRTVEALELGTVDLADIVRAECLLAPGVTADDIDVTELEGIAVRGYTAQGSPRQAIEDLMVVFQFYAMCSDKVYFRLLDAAAALSIAHAQTGAGEDEPTAPFTGLERGNDLEVPSEVTVVSPNRSADYDVGAETSDRLVTAGRRKQSLQSAVVLTPAERKGRANAIAMDARVGMHTAQLSVDDRQAEIEPGDVVTVADEQGNAYTVRITRQAYAAGVHQCDVRLFDRSVLTLDGTTSDTYAPVITITIAADSDMLLLDTGLLRDADDGLHLMAALRPAETGRWGGASVYRSVDDAEFASVASTSAPTVIGVSLDALDEDSGWVWDETSSVTVDVGGSTLASSTTLAMQADASINVCAIGADGRWEILRYRTATLVDPGVYTLSGFLRGLRGTEAWRGTHAAEDNFVKINSALQRIGVEAAELGIDRYWRGVSAGQQVSVVTSQVLSPDGVALKPWAPVNLVVTRDSDDDATLAWHGRSRLSIRYGGPGGTYVQPDATLVGYKLRIYADGSFTLPIRTETTVAAEYIYTAAEQTADGLTPGDPINLRITQISSVVGDGYALEATA